MAEAKPTVLQNLLTRKGAFWIALLAALVADIASKAWADKYVRPLGEAIDPVIPGVFAWKWAMNQGAAFSIFDGKVGFLVLIASTVLGALLWYMFRAEPKRRIYQAALGLVASGAIGNLYDRLLLGAVRDFMFFDFDMPFWGRRIGFGDFAFEIPRRWAVFNVADMAILFGVLILLAMSFQKQEKPAAKALPDTETKPAADASKADPAAATLESNKSTPAETV